MNNIPVNDVLGFFYSIVSRLFSFINSNSLVKWFVFTPIAAAFLCVIFYFIFDVSHILDDYKAKHQKYYKGSKKNNFNKRKYKNKEPVKYGEFKHSSPSQYGSTGHSAKYYKALEAAMKRDEENNAPHGFNPNSKYYSYHETNNLDNYYRKQEKAKKSERAFNLSNNNVFDIEYED